MTLTFDVKSVNKDVALVVIAPLMNDDRKKNAFDTFAVETVIEFIMKYKGHL